MSFLDQYEMATSDVTFQHQVEMAMLAVCHTIAVEDPGQPNHSNRAVLMKDCANAPAGWATQFTLLIAALGTANNADDATVQQAVADSWDVMAGVE